ncbi:MAG: sensor histidine kinase [Hyphomicrobium sp.]
MPQMVTSNKGFMIWAGLALIAGLSAILISLAEGSDVRRVTHTLRVEQALSRLLSAAQDVETGTRGYLLTDQIEFLDPYHSGRQSLEAVYGELVGLVADNPEQSQRIAGMRELIDERVRISDRNVSLFQNGDKDAAVNLMREGHGKAAMDNLRMAITDAKREESELYARRQEDYRWRRRLLGAAMLVTLLASAIMAVVMNASERERSREIELMNRILAGTNESLEARVEERTAELATARDRAETLLRDVTHRIGNTLSLVVGFLNLQIRHASDPASVATLTSARERILAISSAQRRMNVANDLELVRIDSLMSGVMEDLKATQTDQRIDITVDIPPLHAAAQSATSVCVLAQEFVVNALKHAFPDGRAGKIRIRLEQATDGGARLTVSDNGVGSKPMNGSGTDDGTGKSNAAHVGRASGLGLKIADRMAKQFDGAIEIADGATAGSGPTGTTVVVSLPGLEIASVESGSPS